MWRSFRKSKGGDKNTSNTATDAEKTSDKTSSANYGKRASSDNQRRVRRHTFTGNHDDLQQPQRPAAEKAWATPSTSPEPQRRALAAAISNKAGISDVVPKNDDATKRAQSERAASNRSSSPRVDEDLGSPSNLRNTVPVNYKEAEGHDLNDKVENGDGVGSDAVVDLRATMGSMRLGSDVSASCPNTLESNYRSLAQTQELPQESAEGKKIVEEVGEESSVENIQKYQEGDTGEGHSSPKAKEEVPTPNESSTVGVQEELNMTGVDHIEKVVNEHSDTKGKRVIDTYMVFETRFDVDGRYVVTDAVGQGAYGVVCAALDKETQEMVAIKKICNTFEHNMFCKRTLREIKLLRLLDHENIIGVRQILRPIHPANFDDIYVISDLMETDLSCIIKSPQTLSDEHVQFFLYQLLRAVKYIHTSNVIHRDLKPRNLLVNSNCDLKVCDFGLARVDFSELKWKTVAMTDYIATRWYRAPEVMLKWSKYTKAIDMWSVGCILAEMVNRKPIFPGSDTEHQVMLINDILGPFDEDFVSQMKNAKAKEFLNQLQRPSQVDLSTVFRDANPDAVDLLFRLLEVNPTKRITVEEALCHPYMETLHEPEDEPSGTPLSREPFEFEYQFLHTNELRREILEEILQYHVHE